MPSWKKDYLTFRSNNLRALSDGNLVDFPNLNYPSPSIQQRAKSLLLRDYPNVSTVTNNVRLFHPVFFGIGHFSDLIIFSLAERMGILTQCREYKIPKLESSSIPFSLLKFVESYCQQKVSLLRWVSPHNLKLSELEFLRYTHREHYSDKLSYQDDHDYPPVGKLTFAVNARVTAVETDEILTSAFEAASLSTADIAKYSFALNRPYISLNAAHFPDEYVLLHLRTPRGYLCFRDTDHYQYNALVDTIFKATGLPVVRIGLGPALSAKKYLYDLNTIFLQDDLIQLVLNCEYYIGNPSGPSGIPALLKKKTLIIDCATPLTSLTQANHRCTMVHIRELESQPSSSDKLEEAFTTFINTINAQRAPHTLNGIPSKSVRNLVSLLQDRYKEKIKNAHFLANEETIRRYIILLNKGDFTYH